VERRSPTSHLIDDSVGRFHVTKTNSLHLAFPCDKWWVFDLLFLLSFDFNFYLSTMEVNFISKVTDRKGDGLVNEGINAREVVVITDTGENLGVKELNVAIKLASQKSFDLVCVAPNATPPVCRFMDYSKYRYEQQRRAKEAKKNQKIISVKEIRLSPTIDKHDFDTKQRNAKKFLMEEDKVKVSVRFRGRMVEYAANAQLVFERFAAGLDDVSTIEQKPTLEGRNMIMLLTPKIDKTKK